VNSRVFYLFLPCNQDRFDLCSYAREVVNSRVFYLFLPCNQDRFDLCSYAREVVNSKVFYLFLPCNQDRFDLCSYAREVVNSKVFYLFFPCNHMGKINKKTLLFTTARTPSLSVYLSFSTSPMLYLIYPSCYQLS
jgi:hypothetical protein